MANADAFFKQKRREDPEKWQDVEGRYPIQPPDDKHQIYYDKSLDSMIDESPTKRRQRKPRTQAVPKERQRRLDPEEWAEYRKNKAEYHRQWLEDFYHAKELADQGM